MEDAVQDNQELIALLKQGDVAVEVDEDHEHFLVVISDDDSSEVESVKRNIEFSINSAQDVILTLKTLLKSSGNPRFAEAIATLINTMNAANSVLMKINQDKTSEKKNETKQQASTINNTVNNTTVVSSTADILKSEEVKTIDVTPAD